MLIELHVCKGASLHTAEQLAQQFRSVLWLSGPSVLELDAGEVGGRRSLRPGQVSRRNPVAYQHPYKLKLGNGSDHAHAEESLMAWIASKRVPVVVLALVARGPMENCLGRRRMMPPARDCCNCDEFHAKAGLLKLSCNPRPRDQRSKKSVEPHNPTRL